MTFSYVDGDSLLHRRNPVIKFAVVLIWSLVCALSYFPVLPISTFLMAFLAAWRLGNIPLPVLLQKLKLFLAVSLIFMLSMLILRGLTPEAHPLLELGLLAWSRLDLVHVFSLGFRILAIVTLSAGFVLTTRPQDLVLSLIQQCHVPPAQGYAAIAAYRFLPELGRQVSSIHLAQEIRGIPWNRGVASRLSSPFRVMIPLLLLAARRGEQLACAMESRGIGRPGARTYFRRIALGRGDWLFLAASAIVYTALVALMVHFDLYRFSFASINAG